jgi:hypothetical protein
MKIIALGFIPVIVVAVCLEPFFAAKFSFWALMAFTILGVAIWLGLGLAPFMNSVRYGGRITLEGIFAEKDHVRMVRLLRYHLGWSPGKIAAEMNRRELFNLGRPWDEEVICRIIRRDKY